MKRSREGITRPVIARSATAVSPETVGMVVLSLICAVALAIRLEPLVVSRPLIGVAGLLGVAAFMLFTALFVTLGNIQLLAIWAFLLPFSIKAPSESLPIASSYILLYLIAIRQVTTYPKLRIPTAAVPRLQLIAVLGLVTLGLFTSITGMSVTNSLRKLFNILNFALAYMVTIQIVRSKNDVRIIARALIISGALLGLIGLMQIAGSVMLGGGLTGAVRVAEWNRLILTYTEGAAVVNRVPDWSQWWRYNNWYSTAFGSVRATGTAWAPMSYAQMLFVSYFPIMVIVLTQPQRQGWTWFLLLLVMQSAALIATLSRGAWLGIVIGFTIVVAYFLRGRIGITKSAIRHLSLIALVMVIVLTVAAPRDQLQTGAAALSSMFRPEVGISQFDASNNARFSTYQVGLRIFSAYPFLGIGLGNYEMASGGGAGATSHNLYINVAAEMGTLGLVLLLTVLIGGLVNLAYATRTVRDTGVRALAAGWFATLVALMFYWMFTSYFFEPKLNLMVWLILGLTVSLRRIGKLDASR